MAATIAAMTTAIIGVGNLGGTVARHLVGGGEPVVLASKDEAHAKALADELSASAASVEDAIAGADVVVLATWLDQTRELVPARTRLFEDKVVVDPSNPIGFEDGRMFRTLPQGESAGSIVAGLLPDSAHYVKAFGTLGAVEQLATSANRDPRVVLFYATDDDAAEATAQRLIRAAGFEPLKVGGVSEAGRIEGPDGELQGQIFDLDEARGTIATEGAKA
jgi:8-hydroxy-5-deazaflavin:NADPH oxidoreductase